MRYAIGKPGEMVRIILQTGREEDLAANLLDDEVSVEITLSQSVKSNRISIDGLSVVEITE